MKYRRQVERLANCNCKERDEMTIYAKEQLESALILHLDAAIWAATWDLKSLFKFKCAHCPKRHILPNKNGCNRGILKGIIYFFNIKSKYRATKGALFHGID